MMEDCRNLITQPNEGSLSRIVITATISFAKIVQFVAWHHRTHAGEKSDLHLNEPLTTLEKLKDRTQITGDLTTALKLGGELGNRPELQEKVQKRILLYEGPRYKTVT
jgi:hypothetical protein